MVIRPKDTTHTNLMGRIRSTLGYWANSFLDRFGHEIVRKGAPLQATAPALNGAVLEHEPPEDEDRDEGFAEYLAEAQKAGMDLNDYLEKHKDWGDSLRLLEATTYPYIRPDAVILELGAGSGRWSRHLLTRLQGGQLHLVDYSPWKVRFLTAYFQNDPRVHIHHNDGYSLEAFAAASVDLVCSFSTFSYFKLGQFRSYGKEFLRVLKPGGLCVFDFLDITTESGWNWLVEHADRENASCYTYFAPEMVEQVMRQVGFEIVKSREYFEDFHCIVLRKPAGVS